MTDDSHGVLNPGWPTGNRGPPRRSRLALASRERGVGQTLSAVSLLGAAGHRCHRSPGALSWVGWGAGADLAATPACRWDDSLDRCWRSGSGAVMIRSRSWLPAWVRALAVLIRVTRSARIVSAAPLRFVQAGRFAAEGGQRGRHRISGAGLAALAAGLPVG